MTTISCAQCPRRASAYKHEQQSHHGLHIERFAREDLRLPPQRESQRVVAVPRRKEPRLRLGVGGLLEKAAAEARGAHLRRCRGEDRGLRALRGRLEASEQLQSE